MTRRLLIVLSLFACALLATSADAFAAKKKTRKAAAEPKVTSVVPMAAKIGEKLTINGKNLKSKGKTRVYFLREGTGVAWTPADTATKTRVVVTIPEKLIPLLRSSGDVKKPTRFQIRVLAGRFGKPTRLSKSPVISALSVTGGGGTTPPPPGPSTSPPDADCDGDGFTNSVDADDDNDALGDDLESNPAHTDPCDADTDGDDIGDGYEFWSAKDINVAALPYPAKKPWPNPLDSKDALLDHDGDGLNLTDEYLLWKYYGTLSVPLNYSAGLQRSVDQSAPVDPKLAYIDMDGDGKLSDDERDGDNDGLTNWDESHGRMLQDWWDKKYDGDAGPKETRYPIDFPLTSIFDPDSDGDTVLDGADDQDHDGLSNAFEVARPGNWGAVYVSLGPVNAHSGAPNPNPWARVQPYNPCKPVWSHTCHLHPPFDYYADDEDWIGMDRADAGAVPDAPWIYPGSTPPGAP